ncbi:Pol Polyprotein [Phytophthora megakarya]|uniref:Pol Polyprotein n=1 Tax=Phytophthora megakarya TaxID=4795 RepID=A0A225WMA7_9STRA|nr:Pol Polyprotein [Phytophthora megakarya]
MLAHLADVPDTIDGKKGFEVLGTRLNMSTADYPQTDGQTERVSRVVKDMLRSTCAETPKRWSAMLPLVEFTSNRAVHTFTDLTPFYHPRVPVTPSRRDFGFDGGEVDGQEDISTTALLKQVDDFLSTRLSVLRRIRDAMAERQYVQKEQADTRSRGNLGIFELEDKMLLNAKNLDPAAARRPPRR